VSNNADTVDNADTIDKVNNGRRVDPKLWLTRNLKTLAVVSLLQDTASEMLYPILPLFITSVLGAPVAVVGIIEGIADGLASITKIVSGRLADRWQRRPLVGVGYGAAAAAKILIALATSWPVVLLARALDRLGKGVRGAPRDALIADGVSKEHLGRAFGFHRTMDTTGAVIGPLIGLGLFELFHRHYRPVFVVAVVPSVLSAAAVVFVRETPRPKAVSETSSGSGTSGHLPAAFWGPFWILTAFAFVNFSDALLIVRAKHLGLSVTAVIAAYALYNLTYTLASYPAGVLADRIPKQAIIAVGFAIFGASYIALGLVTRSVWVWPIFALYGIYTALTDGVAKAWISATVPSEVRGRALGLQGGAAGVGAIVAGAWAGLSWHGNGRGPLVGAGVIALVLASIAMGLTIRTGIRKASHNWAPDSRMPT
jgi:MFS family permease